MKVREMERQDCIATISRSGVGRLACVRDNRPYVVPISYAYDDNCLYSFSLEGQKIDWMRDNPAVCVLVDEISTRQEWRSVVVDGRFEELPEATEWKHRAQAWSLLQSRNPIWWVPGSSKPTQKPAKGPPHLFYRIRIEGVTGRQALPDG
jgi:nitroimidazol reductase NimA-like FMN-containing flavoprotein (pyridoxamine 5'-phosphate oxidase superfamily)